MSAINEWFGYYQAIFLYIDRKYGPEEFDKYLDYLVNHSYSDVTPLYREGGLAAIEKRYVGNFRKDGDEQSVVSERKDDALTLRVHCPAFYNAPESKHPDRQPGEFLCECCEKLNGKILGASGYDLELNREKCGDCTWCIRKAK